MIIEFYQRFKEQQSEQQIPYDWYCFFLLNLISENKKQVYSNLNIFTPMTKNREYKEYSKNKRYALAKKYLR